MKLLLTKLVLPIAAVICFAVATPGALAARHARHHRHTASSQFRASGTETGRAGESLGHNVKHGRIVHGGKRFGQHIGRAGKDVGGGTETAVKRAVKP